MDLGQMVVGGAHPHPFSEPIGAKMNDVYTYIRIYLRIYQGRDRFKVGSGRFKVGSGRFKVGIKV